MASEKVVIKMRKRAAIKLLQYIAVPSYVLGALFIELIIYGGSAFAQEKADTIIITQKDIERMGVRKIWDVLNQVSGINASETAVSIRGSYKVKVLLDGRPINDPTTGHGSGVRFDLVPLENIEKIEIYCGKGALRYGDDASGGVILITTKKSEAFHGNMKSYSGSFDTSHYSANCRTGKGAIGFGLSMGYEHTDGYQINGHKEKKRAGIKFEYNQNNRPLLSFSADYLKDQRGLSGRLEYPTPHCRKESEMYSYAFTLKGQKILSETFFNDAKTKNRDPDRHIDNWITVKKFGEDISTSIETEMWGKVGCGAALRWAQAESTRFQCKEEYSISLFATDTLAFKAMPLSVSIGLRGTIYSQFKNKINPEAKLSYKNGKWWVSLTYTRTNNIPSFYQRYDKTSTKEPNPRLKMETANNLSVSFFTEVLPRLSCGASLFYNKITDRIAYVLGDNGIGRYENFGEVTYKGADVSLSWEIMKNFSLKGNYSYLEAINEDTGLWMVAKPRHRIYTDLTCVPIEDLSVILNLKYESKQYTRSDNKAWVSGRTICNLRCEYSPEWSVTRYGRAEFFVEVKNIADKTYCYGDGWLAPPRTWLCGVNLTF